MRSNCRDLIASLFVMKCFHGVHKDIGVEYEGVERSTIPYYISLCVGHLQTQLAHTMLPCMHEILGNLGHLHHITRSVSRALLHTTRIPI